VLSPAGGRFSPPTPNPVGVTGPAGDIFKIMAVGGELLIPPRAWPPSFPWRSGIGAPAQPSARS
jgi:hypothetical protein